MKQFNFKLCYSKKKFYKIKKIEIEVYQKYFNEILKEINIHNTTKWIQFQKGDFKKYEIDDRKIFEKLKQVKRNGKIFSLYLQIMIDQYIFADVLVRERNKSYGATVYRSTPTIF